MNPESYIPLVATAIIGIATLAVIPIIKALADLKKQGEEIHKQVNSNLTTQTTELKLANERIAVLMQSSAESDKRVADLLVILNKLPLPTTEHNPSNTVQTIPVTVVNPEPVEVDVVKRSKQ